MLPEGGPGRFRVTVAGWQWTPMAGHRGCCVLEVPSSLGEDALLISPYPTLVLVVTPGGRELDYILPGRALNSVSTMEAKQFLHLSHH